MFFLPPREQANELVTLAKSDHKKFQEKMMAFVGRLNAPNVVIDCIASQNDHAQKAVEDFFYLCRNTCNPYNQRKEELLKQFPIDAMVECAKSENEKVQNWVKETINKYGAKESPSEIENLIKQELAFQFLFECIAPWFHAPKFAREIILEDANSDNPKLKDFAENMIRQLFNPRKFWEKKRIKDPKWYEQSEKEWQSTALSIRRDLKQKNAHHPKMKPLYSAH